MGNSKCNNGSSFSIFPKGCFICQYNDINNSYLYIKTQDLINQEQSSLKIEHNKICLTSGWVSEIVSTLIGNLYIINLESKIPENKRKLKTFGIHIKQFGILLTILLKFL